MVRVRSRISFNRNPLVSPGNYLRSEMRKVLNRVVEKARDSNDLEKLREARKLQKKHGFID